MDWNGDGKHDLKDDSVFNNVINKENNTSDNTPSGGGRRSGGGSSFFISQLGEWVIIIDIILCVAAVFMGYADIIGYLLCFGAITFFIAQWLDS